MNGRKAVTTYNNIPGETRYDQPSFQVATDIKA
jgi:hypothetical protein